MRNSVNIGDSQRQKDGPQMVTYTNIGICLLKPTEEYNYVFINEKAYKYNFNIMLVSSLCQFEILNNPKHNKQVTFTVTNGIRL